MPPRFSILHITPWYPTADDPLHAIWLQRHVALLNSAYNCHVLHLSFKKGGFGWQIKSEEGLTSVTIHFPVDSWRVREWLYAMAVRKFLKTQHHFDHVNFYIAYPTAVHWNLFRKWLPQKVSIMECWSYYHYHFHSQKPLKRIKNIFSRQVPVISVSKALLSDIEQFSGFQFPSAIVYNVVDTKIFRFSKQPIQSLTFFMMSYWKSPKEPFAVIRDIVTMRREGKPVHLRVAGYGPLWNEMIAMSETLDANSFVTFLGPLNGAELALEMNTADAFVHPSGYETFSVAVAEALCCGCPVLTTLMGALPERVNNANGYMKAANESYHQLLTRFMVGPRFDRETIAKQATQLYSETSVLVQFEEAFSTIFAAS